MDVVEEKTVGSDMDWDATPDGKIQTTTTCGEGEVVGVATAGAGQGLGAVKSTLVAAVDLAAEKSTLAAVVDCAEEKSILVAVVDLAAEKSTLTAAVELAEEKSTLAAAVDHAEEKSTIFVAVDLAAEKSTLTAAVELAEGKSTLVTAVDLAEGKSTIVAAVDLAAERSTLTAAVELAEGKSTLAAAVDLAEEKSTIVATVDLAAEKSTLTAAVELAEGKSILAAAGDLAAEKSTIVNAVDLAAEKSTIVNAVDLAAEKSTILAAVDLAAEKSTLSAAVNSKPAADVEMTHIAPETTGVEEKNEVGRLAAGERKEGLEDKVERVAGGDTKVAAETTQKDSHRGQGQDVEHRTEDGASPVQGKADVFKEGAIDEVMKDENEDEVTSDADEKGESAVEAGQAATSEGSQTESSVNEMKEESVHPNKTDNCAATVGDVETIRTKPDAEAEVVVVVHPASETDGMEIESSDVDLTNKADIAQECTVETAVSIDKDFSKKSGLADTDSQTKVDDEKASVKTTSDCGSSKAMTMDEDPPYKPADGARESVDKAGEEATTRIISQAEASDIAGMKVNEAKPAGGKVGDDEVDGPEAIEEDQLKLAKQRRELSEGEGDDTKQPKQKAQMEGVSVTTVPGDPANGERSAMNEEGASAANEKGVEKLKCEVMETNTAVQALSVKSDVASGLVNRENSAAEKADKATHPGEDVEEPGAKTSLPRTKRKLSSEPEDEADKAEHSHAQEKKSKIEDEASEQHRTENVTKESAPLIQDAEMSDVAQADKAEKAADLEKGKAEDHRMEGQPISATSCEQEAKREDSEIRSPRASTSALASWHAREVRGGTLLDTVGWTGETVWKPATELCLSKLVPDNAVPASDLDASHASTSHAANGAEPAANGLESKLSPVPEEAMDVSVSCEGCLPKDAGDSSGTSGDNDRSPPTRQEAARESTATGVTEISMESSDGTGDNARAAPSPGTADPAAGKEARDISGASATGDSVPPEEAEAMQS